MRSLFIKPVRKMCITYGCIGVILDSLCRHRDLLGVILLTSRVQDMRYLVELVPISTGFDVQLLGIIGFRIHDCRRIRWINWLQLRG